MRGSRAFIAPSRAVCALALGALAGCVTVPPGQDAAGEVAIDATDTIAPPPDVLADIAPDALDTTDTVSPPDVPTDAGTRGLTLRSSGLSSVEGENLRSGSLRLGSLGFEHGDRNCVGTLCFFGGIAP